MSSGLIRIRGARQHNLKNIDLDIRTGEMTVVTGPSGSGKSSLVFDTLYAEGQRRYVETFSAYARQFLDRMDRPAVDKVDGVPPAIAIDQTNPVRSSRSTVGTMTELNDHLKLLFARAAQLFDKQTAQPVRHDSPETIYADLMTRAADAGDPRLVITFPVELPGGTSAAEVEQWLAASGYTRVQAEREIATPTGARKLLDVVADRFRIGGTEKIRAIEAIETALKRGTGRVIVYALKEDGEPDLWRYSTGLHCPDSDLRYADPQPALFSFNSAYGACETCRGFGRVIGVDYGLVIPDGRKTLRAGAIKPMQTPAWKDCQDDLLKYGGEAGIPRDTAWSALSEAQRDWVINGTPNWKGNWNKQWYGVKRFFEYLESKSYKMHIRVLLSKYRSYTPCEVCGGARLKTEALLWRLGTKADADAVLAPERRFLPRGTAWNRAQLEALPGLTVHDLMLIPLERLHRFFDQLTLPSTLLDDALKLLQDEIRTRLKYLCDVGIGYLTLDRQSRTLSGGEVQRINLTTALGTSLVNTMFVLDEPSIGLHPRDMNRIVEAMHRLRDAGNTLVVVEHDPAVMLAADRLIDMGPGPGERGGTIVFDGTPEAIRQADTLTGAYLGGRKHVGMGIKRLMSPQTPKLILQGVRDHNLKNVTVEFPLLHLVCVTGVSGSGKSTLMQDVLAPALARFFGKATESPGEHDLMLGADWLSDAVFVDQSPIGKTARSNPASYVGAFDEIRKLFAQAPLAMQRGYGPVIRPLLDNPTRTRRDVEEAAAAAGVDAATVYAWIKAFERSGHLSSLIPKKSGRKTGVRLIDPRAEALIADAIEKHYLRKQRKVASKVVEVVVRDGKGAEPKMRVPHANTVRRRIRVLDPLLAARRRGERVAARRLEPAAGQFPETTRPFQVVQMDHTDLDCIVLDDEGNALHRPWITLAIDVHTRMVVSIALALEKPNAATAGGCVVQMMLPKGPVLAAVDVPGEWPAYGKPEKILMDNAGEFDSPSFKGALEAHAIGYEFRPLGRPEYGGHVERLMLTTAQEIRNLPGATFANVKERKDNKPAKEAIFTLDQIETYVFDWFVNTYNQRRHEGIGMAPILKYRNAVFGTPATKGIGLSRIPADPARLRIDFLPVFKATIQQTGARIDHIHYYDSPLARHIREKVGPLSNKSRKFVFRRDPRKISPVFFWDELTQAYVPIPYANRSNPVISLWEHRAATKRLKAEGKAIDEPAIMGSHRRRERMIEEASAAKLARDKTLRRDKARLKATQRAAAQSPADVPNLRKPAPAPAPARDDYDFSRPVVPPEIIDMDP